MLPMLLIILQRETGSALVYLAFFFMLYREGMPGSILFAGICAVVYFVVGIRFGNELMADDCTSIGEFSVLLLIVILSALLVNSYCKKASVVWYIGGIGVGGTLLALLFSGLGIFFQLLLIVVLMQDNINTVTFNLKHFNAISFWFMLFFVLLNGCKSITNNMVVPMIADCSDYEQYRSGKFVPGLMGALFSFVDKIFAALGTAFVGLVMLLIGYNKTFPQIGDALTPVLRYTTIFLFCGTPIIGWVSSLIALKFYRLDKKKMNEIAAALQEEEIE